MTKNTNFNEIKIAMKAGHYEITLLIICVSDMNYLNQNC